MDIDDYALTEARNRFIAENRKYADWYARDGAKIIDDWFEKLRLRCKPSQKRVLGSIAEAESAIRGFDEDRTDLISSSASIIGMLTPISIALQRLLMSLRPTETWRGDRTPLENAAAFRIDLIQTRQNVEQTATDAKKVLGSALQRSTNALNSATGLLIVRRVTLTTFGRKELHSSVRRMSQGLREALRESVNDEFVDVFSEELKKRVVDSLI